MNKIYQNRFKILSAVLGLILVFGVPVATKAAFNDLVFSADTTIAMATQGINITIVSGSQVASYTVNTGNISFNLENGSSLVIRSTDKVDLANSLLQTVCFSEFSQITINSTITQTIVVTPGTGNICSGGGGGSGGAPIPPVSLPVTPPAVTAHPLGTIINDNGTLYTITTNEQSQIVRRPYTSGGAFLSYGFNSFAQAVAANSADLALPVGSFIPAQDGRVICSDRGGDKGTCYFMTQGKKAGFISADVFLGLGFSFANVYQGDVSFMASGPNITSPTQQHLPGTVVNNNGTIQLIGSNGLLGFPTFDIFTGWGYDTSMVVPANLADKSLTQNTVVISRQVGQVRMFY